MGFLKRDAAAESARGAVTIIAPGNRFTGEMNIVGKLHIDGLFDGRIASLDTISVGKRGELRGYIQAQEIHVSGKIDGEICCTELIIENGGEVKGIVYCDELVIARKGCFIGERRLKSELKQVEQQAAPDPLADLVHPPQSEPRSCDVSDMLGQMLDGSKKQTRKVRKP